VEPLDEVLFERIPVSPGNPFPLGRNVKHDSRSRQYPFRVVAAAKVVDRPIEWLSAIEPLNQGDLGSCTGNAGTHCQACCSYTITAKAAIDPWSNDLLDELYAVHLYSAATKVDNFQGDYPSEDTGSDGLSIAKVLKSRGNLTKFTHIFSLEDAKLAIQDGAFITGTNWYSGMFYPQYDGVVEISGDVSGGHEYAVVGRVMRRGELYWKCMQSWGKDWGDGGFFYLSDATYERLLRENGDATVLHWKSFDVVPEPIQPWVTSIGRWIVDLLRQLGAILGKRRRVG
jgi:hypothetical protein